MFSNKIDFFSLGKITRCKNSGLNLGDQISKENLANQISKGNTVVHISLYIFF
jgi:hypothetical protein